MEEAEYRRVYDVIPAVITIQSHWRRELACRYAEALAEERQQMVEDRKAAWRANPE